MLASTSSDAPINSKISEIAPTLAISKIISKIELILSDNSQFMKLNRILNEVSEIYCNIA